MNPGIEADAALLTLAGIEYRKSSSQPYQISVDGKICRPTTDCDEAFWIAEKCDLLLMVSQKCSGRVYGALCHDSQSQYSATAYTPAIAACIAIEAALKARQPVDPMTLPEGEELDKAVCEAVGLLKGQHPSTDYSDVFDAAYESGICGNLSVTLWLCRQILAFKKSQQSKGT